MNRATLLRRAVGLAAVAFLPDISPLTNRIPVATELTIPCNGFYFMPMDILRDELTGERMLVTAVRYDSITIEKGASWH